MVNEKLTANHKTLLVPLKLKERLDYLKIGISSLFDFNLLLERNVGKDYLASLISFNDNLELERSLFSECGAFYNSKEILSIWSKCEREEDLRSIEDKIILSLPKEGNEESCFFDIYHDQRTIYIVLDGTKPNLLNQTLKDLSREVVKTLSMYYKPQVYTSHPWFNLYLEKL